MSDLPRPPSAPGIVSVPSPYTVAETLSRLEDAIRARGLEVFARFDHSDEAERVGLPMEPAHVLVFGSPKAGTPLMVASPLLALDLPLRALVWRDRDGRVWVSHHAIDDLTRRYAIPEGLTVNIAGVAPLVASALGR